MNLIIIALALFAISLIIFLIVDMVKRAKAYRQAADKEKAYMERWSAWGDMTRIVH